MERNHSPGADDGLNSLKQGICHLPNLSVIRPHFIF